MDSIHKIEKPKEEPKIEIKEEPKLSISSTKIIPKHNNLLVSLLILLFILIAALGALFVYQNQPSKTPTESTTTTNSTTNNTTDTSDTDNLDAPVIGNIDSEVSNLDGALRSDEARSTSDFSSDELTDQNIGL